MTLGGDRNSKALDNEAGPDLQKEIGAIGKIGKHEILQTDGYNLFCKNLYFIRLQEWSEDNSKVCLTHIPSHRELLPASRN